MGHHLERPGALERLVQARDHGVALDVVEDAVPALPLLVTDYLYPHTWARERHRLAAIERLWDPGTLVALERCGIARGWRCLETGAGAGSIARWLAQRVAPEGSVLATDLDLRHLDLGGHPNLEGRRHDIASDPLPAAAFDLVHARLVLKHLPARARALATMVGALRPGGWLVAEDTDWSSAGVDPPAPAFAEALRALRAVTHAAGGVPDYGRALPAALAAAGLAEVGSSRASHRLRCGTPEVEFFRLTFEQVRERVVAGGLIAARRLDAALETLDAPGSVATSFTMVTAWGRKAGPSPHTRTGLPLTEKPAGTPVERAAAELTGISPMFGLDHETRDRCHEGAGRRPSEARAARGVAGDQTSNPWIVRSKHFRNAPEEGGLGEWRRGRPSGPYL